ncbi:MULTISPECIES: oxidoreductase [Streptomyces]|uniref:oxidoreductase n=1 Tax=Streptomyces TaxID=1883 RepID=UPI00140E824C|nr:MULTISPECIES: oxidoreductase [Streptomyces]MDH6224191.1 alkylation response protein AidB-like acyl-CoA dehydrogenase [Streptomyces sp. MJP52]
MMQCHNPAEERADEISPVLPASVLAAAESAATHAVLADDARRLGDETVALLTRAGFARHFVPRAWGGPEGTFGSLFAAAAAVGEGCASAAWCAVLWAAHSRFAAYLPPDGQRELWGAGPDVRICASVRPSGQARRLPFGRLLSGEWECVSGVDFADWLLVCASEPGAEGAAGPRMFAVPKGDFRVRDSWNGSGMRGTGSHTVVLENAFVPDHRSFPMADLLAGTPGPGRSRCHTVPAHLAGGLLFCAPALGAARGALAAWSVWAARTQARDLPQHDGSRLHHTLARSADDIEAAELLLLDAARAADAGARGESDVLRNRRRSAAAVDLLVEGVERLFRTAGTGAGGRPGPIERSWRDVHTVAAHQMLRREAAAMAYAASVFSTLGDHDSLTTVTLTALQEASAS